jgi:hypothetical protein
LQLNRLLARDDGELELLEADDARTAAAEAAAWAAQGGAPAAYARLAADNEVTALVAAAIDQAMPKDPDKGKEFGRGKRRHAEAGALAEMGVREFGRLCADGAGGAGNGKKVPLLAADAGAIEVATEMPLPRGRGRPRKKERSTGPTRAVEVVDSMSQDGGEAERRRFGA